MGLSDKLFGKKEERALKISSWPEPWPGQLKNSPDALLRASVFLASHIENVATTWEQNSNIPATYTKVLRTLPVYSGKIIDAYGLMLKEAQDRERRIDAFYHSPKTETSYMIIGISTLIGSVQAIKQTFIDLVSNEFMTWSSQAIFAGTTYYIHLLVGLDVEKTGLYYQLAIRGSQEGAIVSDSPFG